MKANTKKILGYVVAVVITAAVAVFGTMKYLSMQDGGRK